jgi:hypothetical protein
VVSSPQKPNVSHEASDVNIRAIFGFGAALLVVAVLLHVAVWLLFLYMSRETAPTTRNYPLATGQENRLPPEPRLQTNPREDLRALRAREDELLNAYSWVDRSGGIVRIPIREAIRLTLERGLPSRPEATGQSGRRPEQESSK